MLFYCLQRSINISSNETYFEKGTVVFYVKQVALILTYVYIHNCTSYA